MNKCRCGVDNDDAAQSCSECGSSLADPFKPTPLAVEGIATGEVSVGRNAMRKIFTAPSQIPCDFLCSLLAAEDIPTMMKNEGGSSITGNSAMIPGGECAWAWPEVWVNEEDYEIASQIAAEFEKSHQPFPEQ